MLKVLLKLLFQLWIISGWMIAENIYPVLNLDFVSIYRVTLLYKATLGVEI